MTRIATSTGWLVGLVTAFVVGMVATPLHAHAGGLDTHVRTWHFPSGFTVALLRDDRFPVVRAALGVRIGSADAPDGKGELSHLLEHVAFRSAWGDLPLIDGLTARGCTPNGTTWADHTTYQAACPSDMAEDLVGALVRLSLDPLQGVTQADVDQEVRIVAREWDRAEDLAARPIATAMTRALFPSSHPYRLSGAPLADLEGAQRATLEELAAGMIRSRRILVVVGDMTPDALFHALATQVPGTWAHPDLVDATPVVYPAEALHTLRIRDDQLWWPDPSDPTQPLAPIRMPEPIEPTPRPPDPPSTRTREVEAAVDEPMIGFGWSLPGVETRRFGRYAAWTRYATADLEAAVDGTRARSAGCVVRPMAHHATLTCLVQPRDVPVERLQPLVSDAFAEGWTMHREARMRAVHSDLSDEKSDLWSLDDGSLDLATGIAEMGLLANVTDWHHEMRTARTWLAVTTYRTLAERHLTADRMVSVVFTPEEQPHRGSQDTVTLVAAPPLAPAADPAIQPLPDSVRPHLDRATYFSGPHDSRGVLWHNEGIGYTWMTFTSPFRAEHEPVVATVAAGLQARFDGDPWETFHVRSVSGRLEYGLTFTSYAWEEAFDRWKDGVRTMRWSRPSAKWLASRVAARTLSWGTTSWLADLLRYRAFVAPDHSPADDLLAMAAARKRAPEEMLGIAKALFDTPRVSVQIVGKDPSAQVKTAIDREFKPSAPGASPTIPEEAAPVEGPLVQPGKLGGRRAYLVETPQETARTVPLQVTCPIAFDPGDPARALALADTAASLLDHQLYRHLRVASGATYEVSAVPLMLEDRLVLQVAVRVFPTLVPAAVGAFDEAVAAVSSASLAQVQSAARTAARQASISVNRTTEVMQSLSALQPWQADGSWGRRRAAAFAHLTAQDLQSALAPCSEHAVLIASGPASLQLTPAPTPTGGSTPWHHEDPVAWRDRFALALPPALAKQVPPPPEPR